MMKHTFSGRRKSEFLPNLNQENKVVDPKNEYGHILRSASTTMIVGEVRNIEEAHKALLAADRRKKLGKLPKALRVRHS